MRVGERERSGSFGLWVFVGVGELKDRVGDELFFGFSLLSLDCAAFYI